MTDLAGRVAVVAGSARGIGRAVAQRHARSRTSVVVRCSMGRDTAERTVTGIGAAEGRVAAERADVSSSAGLTRSFASAIDVCARLDLVVFANAPRKAFDRSIDIAVVGVLAVQLGARNITVDSFLPAVTPVGASSPMSRRARGGPGR